MASSSSNLTTNAIGHAMTERLTKTNYPLWKIQVLPALHGAQLIGYIDGLIQAPAVEIDDEKEKKVSNRAYAQ
uniref:Retrotransposon Copia-like N-terminal domain-containing protein n=1 Tax=Arundo donax TaxID=35708 RepID=A0A0A8YJE7_ARUDO